MTRRLCWSVLAIGLFAAATLQLDADAQTVIIGRRGVQYNGYGQGYYGGYGQGYSVGYGPAVNNGYFPGNVHYSSYGNGPYGYGVESSRQFPPVARYGYGNRHPNVRVYSPYGYGTYNPYAW